MQYADVADAIAPTGMVARGGFVDEAADRPCTIVVIGNVGGAMWPAFRAGEPQGNDPLDTWTRAVLCPIAAELGADFVHPSDQPYQPFQRWAQRADAVWPSPLGLLIHAEYGLWHAYRGAFVFPFLLDSLPPVAIAASPCVSCAEQWCLHACPVDAFTGDGYAVHACREHVAGDTDPRCREVGCAARLACPVGRTHQYGSDQMRFHMQAFIGR